MPRPIVNDLAEDLYADIKPVTYADESLNWPLLKFVHSWTNIMVELFELSVDSDDGPGWSAIMDVDRVPDDWALWLSRFVGVRDADNLDPEEIKERVRAVSGLRRGGPQSIIEAAQATLTGTKSVNLVERHGSPWRLTVTTLSSETPDAAATLRAILQQKPAGIVMAHGLVSGDDYTALLVSHSDYNDIIATYDDYAEVLSNPTL